MVELPRGTPAGAGRLAAFSLQEGGLRSARLWLYRWHHRTGPQNHCSFKRQKGLTTRKSPSRRATADGPILQPARRQHGLFNPILGALHPCPKTKVLWKGASFMPSVLQVPNFSGPKHLSIHERHPQTYLSTGVSPAVFQVWSVLKRGGGGSWSNSKVSKSIFFGWVNGGVARVGLFLTGGPPPPPKKRELHFGVPFKATTTKGFPWTHLCLPPGSLVLNLPNVSVAVLLSSCHPGTRCGGRQVLDAICEELGLEAAGGQRVLWFFCLARGFACELLLCCPVYFS